MERTTSRPHEPDEEQTHNPRGRTVTKDSHRTPRRARRAIAGMLAVAAAAAFAPACSGDGSDTLTIYSGREQALVQPLLERFAEEQGVAIEVRYGDTAELAATLLEEGDSSPADVFYAQDAGSLGALDAAGMLQPLPQALLDAVDDRWRAEDGDWIGFSGRARVVAYSTERVDPSELPDSILDFTDPEWRGRIGWAPTNGSFQSFVTELRQVEGEEAARAWLEGIQANDPVSYESNIPAELGIADGEVDVAFVNHYYLYILREEEGDGFPVENGYMAPGDPGSLVNVAGSGILSTADSSEDAQAFIRFMLEEEAQRYFATETFEYPLADGVPPEPELRPLTEIVSPDVPLSDLSDLPGTLELLQDTGVLP
jgi:iron(III) transport system substrate-binding protein